MPIFAPWGFTLWVWDDELKKLIGVYKQRFSQTSGGSGAVDLKLSDRELFEKYPMQDLFLDGKLHECFFYVYNHEALRIPDSWVDTMATFHRELKVAVT